MGKNNIKLSLVAILCVTSMDAFSLKDGYIYALQHDIDSQVNANNLESINHDKAIADSLFFPKIDLSARAEVSQNSQNQSKSTKSDQYGAKITQPLFDGYEAKYEKELQNTRYQSAQYYLKESQNKLALSYVDSYINTLKQTELLTLRVENLVISEDIFNKVYKKVSVGYGTKLEFETAKENYTKSKVDLSSQKINYRDAITSLKFYVQQDFDTNELIKPQFYYDLPKSLPDAMRLAKMQNPSYLVAKTNVQVAMMEQKRDLKIKYPSLALVGSYDKYDSFRATNDPYDEYKVAIELNYNLYNGGKDSALNKKAMQKIKEKKYLIQKSQYQIENQLRLSWNSYTLNKDKKLKLESFAQAKKEVLYATIKEFDLGLKDLNTLMDEHTAYISAKSDLIRTSYDLMLAQYRVLESIGVLSSLMDDPSMTLEKQLSAALTKETLSATQKRIYVDSEDPVQTIKRDIVKKEPIKQQPNPLVALINPVKKKVVVVREEKPKAIVNSVQTFKEQFLNASKDKYTINLAYSDTSKYAQRLLNRYNLNDNGFYFSFGQTKKFQKIMMGIYDSKAQAQTALNNLPKSLKKAQPRVESISIKQKLYHKYHGDFTPVKEKKKQKVIIAKVIIPKPLSPKKDNTFKEIFLRSPRGKYTINLAYAKTEKYAQDLLDKYNLNDNGFYFSFRKVNPLQRIVMGVFDTKKEAFTALRALPPALKKNDPIVERIERKQKTYYKYHANEQIITDEVKKVQVKKEVPVVAKIAKKPVVQDNIEKIKTYETFKETFLNASKNMYTINLAYSGSSKLAQEMLDRYKLNGNSFYFSFRKPNPLQRIVMGIFSSKQEAQQALNRLPKGLKRNKPMVEPIAIKQKVYHKYHSQIASPMYLGSL
ncbi:MAG: TolC family protein [Campylobacterota bacterium]|nr:TolC family protein [Campylobacterota bacterium]